MGRREGTPVGRDVRRNVCEYLAAECQLVFSNVVRERRCVPGRPGEIPAVNEQLRDPQIECDCTRDFPEGAIDYPLKRPWLAESIKKLFGRVSEAAGKIS